MAKVDLSKVQREAKKIRKLHPNKGNAAVMKEAWSVARGGKLSGVGKGKKKKGKSAKSVGTKPKYKVIHEVRRIGGVSYTGGSIKLSGVDKVERAKKDLLHRLGEQAGWLAVAISQERTVTGRRKLNKKLAEVKAEMNRIK